MQDAMIHRVACRHLIHIAVERVLQEDRKVRVASRGDRDMVVAILEGTTLGTSMEKSAGLGNLMTRARRVWEIFRKAPELGTKIKKALNVESIKDLPKALREWSKKGLGVMKKLLKKISESFPVSLYLAPKSKMPSLTDLLGRIIASSPKIEAALKKVKTNVLVPLDKWIEKHAPNLSRPLKAAVFVWIWINVAEISWDLKSMIDGFTGNISFGELFGSLPESGVGAVLALFGVGYHLLPITIIARLVWLAGKKYISWDKGKIVVNWERIDGSKKTEALPVFA